ncbi:MAG: superoxide dismutase family protein [Alphaproteobacteria bacterium]|nr:superoxide dismutase family protein [Alphaproteobacteria bacterium]TAD91555.1 MAG: superoxide dismutase family protein [Alphaproteobacteria bacterium]
MIKRSLAAGVLAVMMGLSVGASAQAPTLPAASATIINRAGEAIGEARFTEGPRGVLVYVRIRAGGLPPGPHGTHIHSVGTCDDREQGFVASGAHLGAPDLPHGLLNPTGDYGDLPNLFAHADGSVEAEMFTTLISLSGTSGRGTVLDANGAAIVIHAARDDHLSQPIGNSGARIACGVIR